MMTDARPKFSIKTEIDAGDSSAQSNLANELEREKDARNEERYLFFTVIVVLFDAIIFAHVENWAGAIVIGVVELVGLAVLARKWRVQEVAQFLAMFFQRVADHTKPPAASNPPTPEIPAQSSPPASPSPPESR